MEITRRELVDEVRVDMEVETTDSRRRQSPQHPSRSAVDASVAADAFLPEPGCKASGVHENALSRSVRHSMEISQARDAWIELGLGHLLIPDDAQGCFCGAKDARGTCRATGSASAAGSAQSQACSMSDILRRYGIDPSWDDADKADADGDGFSGVRTRRSTRRREVEDLAHSEKCYDLRDDDELQCREHEQSTTEAQAGAVSISPDAQPVPTDDDDVVEVVVETRGTNACATSASNVDEYEVADEDVNRELCLYVNGATAKSKHTQPNNPLLERDSLILGRWGAHVDEIVLPGNRDRLRARGGARDAGDSGQWFSDRLMDFGVALYGGNITKEDRRRIVLLTPSYFSAYICPLRRHGDPETTAEFKENMVSGAQSHRVFRVSGKLMAGGERSLWETEGVYIPVFVDRNHWILVAVTNLCGLYSTLVGDKALPGKGDGDIAPPRILVVDSNAGKSPVHSTLSSSHLTVVENIQHWVATMFMVSSGYKEEQWKCGMYRWAPPPEGKHTFAEVRSAVRVLLQSLLPPCPKQRDGHSCGPYTLLALYFLSGKHDMLRSVADLSDMSRLHLPKAYEYRDAKELASNMADAVSALAARQLVADDAGETSEETGVAAAESVGALFKTPFVSAKPDLLPAYLVPDRL